MKHNAIPTTFNGVNFRSRLEAKWAAMFDLLSWRWTYEPVDLNGYIPDFVLHFRRPLLVEVKGVCSFDELKQHTAKIERSGWEHEAMLVGGFIDKGDMWNPQIGLLRDSWYDATWGKDDAYWVDARLKFCSECRLFSVFSTEGCYRCRVGGCNDGNQSLLDAQYARLLNMWTDAGNLVQWMGHNTNA